MIIPRYYGLTITYISCEISIEHPSVGLTSLAQLGVNLTLFLGTGYSLSVYIKMIRGWSEMGFKLPQSQSFFSFVYILSPFSHLLFCP